MKRCIEAGIIALVFLICWTPGKSWADDTSTVHETGVWQAHKYTFTFTGFTTTYSCDGLAGKLKRLLIVAGAREDAKSFPGACSREFGQPSKIASAYLTFSTLSAAGPGNATKHRPLAATWRPVTFADHAPRELGVGDCELIEQFRDNVLKMFTTRNVEDHTTCIAHQNSGSHIDLKFESLVAFPDKPTGAQNTYHTASNQGLGARR